ncbi:exonuclease SbcCD subunit D [Salsipaludibacter albus]|uniref:exonuclease SbcCD subunit D n=1 Tax=Salsipaludibacter albus TaxID=2849650 RepID=UPI001EE4DF82|nr:exonuclease SbcCD subunit D [Salsipaludibacter albus]MBY5161768.1 exonuclease SbcCD subunit D [Salsipaludibacter albus]
MKLLHTSDWHVGRAIRGRSRGEEHRAVLAEIAGIAHDEAVDLVVVAGDLFDTASPTPIAERIVYQALRDLAATGAEVVVLSGNHDNPRRWQAIHRLLDGTNVHIVGEPCGPDEGGVLTFPALQTRVAVLPFVSKRGIVRSRHLMERRADDHEVRYAERIRRMVATLTRDFGDDMVNVFATHLTVADGAPVLGGGERAAHIFDYLVSPAIFPASATYVALGHLHQPHQVAAPCPTWYAGSPLHLDFGEVERDHKAVILVEAQPGLPASVTPVALHEGRPLRTVRGRVADLEARRDELLDAHVRLVLTEPGRPGLADEVREAFPNVVDVRVEREDEPDDGAETWDLEDFHRSPADLFAMYLEETGQDDPAVRALFDELWEASLAPDQA